MDRVKEININEAIIHVLDNNSDEAVLNEYSLELNEERYKFILTHVEKVLKDNDLKYAVFNTKKDLVKDVSQKYLDGHFDLIRSSKDIASHLFSLMNSNVRIPSCDLIVVSISTEYGPMLGILKLDYIKAFTHKIDFINDAVGIDITPIKTGLPSNKKIQKAAFIKPGREDQEYQLLVLDKGNTNNDDYGSNYFIDNFLGCKLIDNDRDKTKLFIELMESWTRNNLTDSALMAEHVRIFIKDKLKELDIINIYALADELFNYKDSRKSDFIAYMQSNELEEFPVDKEYVEKKFRKVKIKVGSGIELSVLEEYYNDINCFEISDNGDGSIQMIIKNVERYIEK